MGSPFDPLRIGCYCYVSIYRNQEKAVWHLRSYSFFNDFSFSSYPLQLPVFIVTFIALLLACVCGNSRWEWIGLAILAVAVGGFRLKNDLRIEQACREWMNVRVLYNAGAYESGEREYVSFTHC